MLVIIGSAICSWRTGPPSEYMADAIFVIHFLWVLCVIVPVPLIIIGAFRHWRWIRSYKLRTIHLAMMVIVGC